jgi:hypothetical protein
MPLKPHARPGPTLGLYQQYLTKGLEHQLRDLQ